MNLWHEVPVGDEAPKLFNAIIEIPKGSYNKYEIDKETGLIALDRANYTAAPYPFDYGFAPQTYWEDNDPLDVVVLTTFPLDPGILVVVRPVAVLDMIDDGESDMKIIAVPANDKRWDDVNDLEDLNKHNLKEFEHFFQTYKALKGKEATVETRGYKGRAEAEKIIKRSIELYEKNFGSKS
jgi:inorganic pyrophosphatase